jgi:hypothetical protein
VKVLILAVATLLAVIVPLVYAGLQVDEKGFVTLELGDEEWQDYPGVPAIKMMVVEGDPMRAGPYVIRVKFAAGTMSMPHYHSEDRLVTVLKGSWWTGKGRSFDPDSTDPLSAGGYMKHPAGEAHYDGAKDEEVILQIVGIGPSTTTFFDPELGATGTSR